jgi:CPA2 family monovalent cation:H+ antiporter-2
MSQLIIFDLLTILAAGFAAGLLCRLIKVPMLIGYLVVGALIGGGGLGWITDQRHEIEYFAEAGALLLLFSIGLEFSLEELTKLGRHILLGGSTQMILTALPATAVGVVVGLEWRSSVLLGLSIALSSTVLVYKALAEYGQTASPAGRRSLAILLFQDIAIVPILLMIPLLTAQSHDREILDYLFLTVNSAILVLLIPLLRMMLQRWVTPFLSRLRSPELIVLFAITLLGLLTAAAYKAGLPPPLGAFAAGLVLNGNRLTGQIDALILPFREAFAAIFFVSLGMLFRPEVIRQAPIFTALAFVGIILLKLFAGSMAVRLTGLKWRSSIGIGLGLSQIGEFAFILAFAGLQAGMLSKTGYDYLLVFALGTLILTPLMLKVGLRWSQSAEEANYPAGYYDVEILPDDVSRAVVVGIGHIGKQLSLHLETRGIFVYAVDLSAVNLHPLAQQGIVTVAGDAQDPATLERARVKTAQLAIVCVPDDSIAVEIIRTLRAYNPECTILVRCRYRLTMDKLKQIGADIVIAEEMQTAKALIDILTENDII